MGEDDHLTRQQALEMLRACHNNIAMIDKWNAYREDHRTWKPDLSDASDPAVLNGMSIWYRCGTTLTAVNLQQADLTEAHLNYANLTGVNLHGAILTGATLLCAVLSEAKLMHANLANANLVGADLGGRRGQEVR